MRPLPRLALAIIAAAAQFSFAGVRTVPERMDDLAFENDVVAFRTYGPALRDSAERSGLDAWMKKVSYPVIEKWYVDAANGKSYHKDHGEGYDPYHVGASLGAGSIGLWVDGQLVTANVYQSVEILVNQPDRAEFLIEYLYEGDHSNIREERHVSLQPGEQLLRVRSQFYEDGIPSKQQVAVGIATHDGKAQATLSQDGTRVATWESIDGLGVGTTAIVPYRRDQKNIEIKSDTKDKSHALILTETDARGAIVYYAGFAWEGAGKIKTSAAWSAYLDTFQQALPEQFYVTANNRGTKALEKWQAIAQQTPYQPRLPNGPTVSIDSVASTSRSFVKAVMDSVLEFQTQAYGGAIDKDWTAGTFYTGVYAAFQATQDQRFHDAAFAWAEAADWKLGNRILNADTICMGQTMMDIYLDTPDKRYIADIKPAIDSYFDWGLIKQGQLHGPNKNHFPPEGAPFIGRKLWWWCDSLYMAPPVLARLYSATGEQRYLDLMHKLYWDTVAFLYDEDANLFFRDENFLPSSRGTTTEEEKIFWSRGNGWVYGGLIRTLDYIPENDPMRQRYLKLYQEMTRKIVTLQRADGLWNSWLNRPDLEQTPETSGTAFYTFGILAGINRGWLDAKSYLPVALRGWNGLVSKTSIEGRLGFAQLIDAAPNATLPESFIDYTHGAFLLAASELYKMDLQPDQLAALMPPYQKKLILEDAAWTWYNDERATIADQHLYVGGVDSKGNSVMQPYRLNPVGANSISKGPTILSTWQQTDDHNNPAFLRFDDKLLVTYAAHHKFKSWNYRIATVAEKVPRHSNIEIDWSEEKTFPAEANCTYSNLFQLKQEGGKIYNFYRGEGFNPNVAWSTDSGETWQGGFQFIQSGDGGTRPYVKYASNGKDRIDLIYTDGHPRNEAQNNLYQIYYQNGAFYKSDGTKIRDFADVKTTPLKPEEGTRIYDGSGPLGRAWSHDFAIFADGTQLAAFITSPDGSEGSDLRYWVAAWNPQSKTWTTRQIAYAGNHNYPIERHYAGGISLDPDKKGVVYISSDVVPSTGKATSNGRNQIYRAQLPDTADQAIDWQQLTFDPHVDNNRPFVPHGHKNDVAVLWVRGDYRTYQNYQCDIYGIGF